MPPHQTLPRLPVLSMALLAAATAACRNAEATAPAAAAPPPTPVVAAPVAIRDLPLSDELTGRIEAVDAVQIRPRVSGTVTSVRYREGGPVTAGAVLFTIDARPYQAELARASAELARAQANVELARLNVGRSDKLIASSAITRAEHDTTTSTAAAAEAEVRAASAQVTLARLDLEFTEVRAPIAGRVGQALVSLGDYVAAGPAPTPLTTVVSLDPVYAYFTGDEQTFLRFGGRAVAAPAQIGLADEPDFPHVGKIDFVDNRLDAQTGTMRFRAVLANPDHRLTPGLYARVRLNEPTTERAALVADKAVLTDQDRKYVYVVGAGEVVERRDVKLGRVVDGQRVITSGVRDGDRVIISGVQKVFPGAHVAVSAPPAKTADSGAQK